MRNAFVSKESRKQPKQLREELPGSWYNFESTEITLDLQEFDHWLAKLDASEFSLEPQHRF